MVSTGKRNIKDDGESIIHCLWIEWQIFLFAHTINKITRKMNGSMWVPITRHKEKNTWMKRICIYPHGTWRDNIRSVILDRRQRSGWSLKRRGEIRLSFKWRERPAGYSSKHVVCVLQPSHYSTKRVPATEERYVRTLSDCIPTSHNRCLSSGPICDNLWSLIYDGLFCLKNS